MLNARASLPAGQDQETLFREEVLAARRQTLEGDVIVRSNRWLFAGTLVLLGVLAIALIFLCFADVPRIEQSRGWLTTTGGLVHVEAFRVGVVEHVAVAEGQHVEKGAVLATIRVENLQSDLGVTPEAALLESMRDQDGKLQNQIDLTMDGYGEDTRRLAMSVTTQEQELEALREQIARQETIVSYARQLAATGETLLKQDAISKREVWQQQSDVAQKAGQLAYLQQQSATLQVQIDAAQSQLKRAPLERDIKVAELQTERASLQQRLNQTRQQQSYTLTAPISGRITGLVAKAGYPADGHRPLLAIIPDKATLSAELFVPSSAIAFLKPGQRVRLLYDAFPYQRFGGQNGRVSQVGTSALLPSDVQAPIEVREPVYVVSVALDGDAISAFGARTRLQPGMTLQANIILESRSVFEWLLEPVYAIRGRL